jgi:hypothetical protein
MQDRQNGCEIPINRIHVGSPGDLVVKRDRRAAVTIAGT